MREALNVAEAGVGEALGRISHQDVVMDAANPRAVCQVFNTYAGTVPVLGTDSTALATAQPTGAWLDYTTEGRSGDELTISWKKNAAGTKVMRYRRDGDAEHQRAVRATDLRRHLDRPCRSHASHRRERGHPAAVHGDGARGVERRHPDQLHRYGVHLRLQPQR
jgi:hypothetical protein